MQLSILDGNSWTKRTARSGFPILVEYARNRREITYGEWDAEIVRRGLGSHVLVVQYGHPAGRIGDVCEAYAEETGVPVPAINLMVVNKTTRVPAAVHTATSGDSVLTSWIVMSIPINSASPSRGRLSIVRMRRSSTFPHGAMSSRPAVLPKPRCRVQSPSAVALGDPDGKRDPKAMRTSV